MKTRLAFPLLLLIATLALAGCGDDEGGGGSSDASAAVNEAVEVDIDEADPDATEQPQDESVLLKLQQLERGQLSTNIPAIRGSQGLSVPDWMRTVNGDIATYWQTQFNQAGFEYEVPKEMIYDSRGRSGCGRIGPDDGPFYCPVDQTIYLPVAFFEEQYQQFGDAAVALVIAHENGHHAQQLLGIFDQGYLTAQTELQADCLAGAWSKSTFERGLLEDGDIAEILGLTEISGDTAGTPIQQQGAHGSGPLRVDFFNQGYQGGPDACPVPERRQIRG